MKKKIFLFAICIAGMSVYVNAQKKNHVPPPPPPAPPLAAKVPQPPPPPEPIKFIPPRIVKDGIDFKINGNNGKTIVSVYKNKKQVDKVNMTEWNSHKAFYEKKYGQLPPPPPPAPPVPPVPAYPRPH